MKALLLPAFTIYKHGASHGAVLLSGSADNRQTQFLSVVYSMLYDLSRVNFKFLQFFHAVGKKASALAVGECQQAFRRTSSWFCISQTTHVFQARIISSLSA